MSIESSAELAVDAAEAWRYLAAPGALHRLSPPFLPMRPVAEAGSLRDGEALLAPRSALPVVGGARLGPLWRARHDPRGFVEGERFVDRCVSQPYAGLTRWVHEHTVAPAGPGRALVGDRVTARVPERMLAPVFAYRHRQMAADLEALAALDPRGSAGAAGEASAAGETSAARPLTVAVTGASGLVGTALTALLGVAGHRVVRLVRGRPDPAEHAPVEHAPAEHAPAERPWDPAHPAADLLDGVDVLVHLAGAPVAGRFTDAHLARVRDSRVGPTRRLAELVAAGGGRTALVCASAVGFYGGDRGDERLTESAEPGTDDLARIVVEWESACDPARDAGARVVNVRTGLVLSGAGGLLPPLAAVARTGLGGRLGSGRHRMSWIALDDLADVYLRAITHPEIVGPVNAVAPTPVRNDAFTDALGAVLRRPTPLPVPGRATAVLLGERGASQLALADQRVEPAVLAAAGHRFRWDDLRAALAHELGRDPATESC